MGKIQQIKHFRPLGTKLGENGLTLSPVFQDQHENYIVSTLTMKMSISSSPQRHDWKTVSNFPNFAGSLRNETLYAHERQSVRRMWQKNRNTILHSLFFWCYTKSSEWRLWSSICTSCPKFHHKLSQKRKVCCKKRELNMKKS